VTGNSGSYSGLNEIDAREKISMKRSKLLIHETGTLIHETMYADFMRPIIIFALIDETHSHTGIFF
jgi:hypothetical protein